MLAGRSGVRPLTEEWAEELPVQIAGRVAVEPTEVLERVKARRLDRSSQFAMVAAMEAWADCGLEGATSTRSGSGVAMASGIGGVTTLLDNYDALKEKGPRRVSPLAVPMLMPNAPAAQVSLYVGARAAVNTPVSACASGNEAIALAVDQIRLGRADVVLAGGTEAAIHPLPMAAFANMMALSKNADDPPTVVPSLGHRPRRVRARRGRRRPGAGVRGARPGPRRARLRRGPGRRDHRRRPRHRPARPGGRGGSRAIVRALEESQIDPSSIVHVNAHATSTPQGDIAEGLMLHATLGAHVDQVVVTTTKSMTGHLLGGAGALEAIATILARAPPDGPADDQPRRPGPPGRARHRHQAARPAGRRHRRAQQLLRLRRRQRRRRLREHVVTATPAAPAKPANCPASRIRATR